MTMRMTFDELCVVLRDSAQADRVQVVAISGFSGSGKSTLASQICERFDDVEIVGGDDFSVRQQSERCDDWASIDRTRLREQVLEPARMNQPIRYQQYDWPNDKIGDWRDVGLPKLLIVEGIGIVHPELLSFFGVTVWIDVPLAIANERGRYRDKEIYKVDHDALWRDLWTPNDRDYFNRYRPDQLVDIVYTPGEETVEIEEAGVEDAESIAELTAEIERYYGSVDVEPMPESVAKIKRFVFGPRPSAFVLLARVNNNVVGMATYSFLWPASGTTQSMFLKELYVRPEYRHQGVARRFMDRLREIAKENECDRIDWTADKSNGAAVGFYAAQGVTMSDDKLFYRMPVN